MTHVIDIDIVYD